jgi:8-oxo-dGTP diphosphatase
MPTLRATALAHAPARTVTGAVIELVVRRARVVSITDLRVDALPLGPFRAARLTCQCAETAAGTLVTCSFSWIGGVLDTILARKHVLAVAQAVVDGAKARAESLVDARVVVGTAIVRDGRLLAQQRAFPAAQAGKWELPGGRVEPGESDVAAVRRECAEELGVDVSPGERIGPDVVLPGGKLLRIYRGVLDSGDEPTAREHKALRWLGWDELADVDWLPADELLLESLVGALRVQGTHDAFNRSRPRA